MKRVWGAFLVMALLVAGCGATPSPTPAAKLTIPWGTGDRAEYAIQMNGQAVGTIVFTTAAGTGDGYVITTETSAGTMKDVSKVRVDKNLKPIGETREVSGAGKADFTLLTIYDKGKLSIQAKTADGDKSASIDVPADAWDNDQSLMSIRALPLAENYTFAYTNIVGANANVMKIQLKVVGKEDVAVPAGAFSAYKVEMAFAQSAYYAWYDANEPHQMVKYENTDSKQTIVLTKIGN